MAGITYAPRRHVPCSARRLGAQHLSVHSLVSRRMNAMNRIPVFFATTEGHTRRIAETIASVLREQGFQSEAVSMSESDAPYDWSTAVNAVVGASLHRGRHQPCAEKFVRREGRHLNARPAGFLFRESERRITQSNRGGGGPRHRREVPQSHRMAAPAGGLLSGQAGLHAIRLRETVVHAPYRRARRGPYRHQPRSRSHGLGGGARVRAECREPIPGVFLRNRAAS